MVEKKRRYEDGCAFAQALDLVGERWALLVIRELVFGPRRFSDLRLALPGIAANMLTQRLADLEAGGVIRRETLPPPVRAQVYALTEWGQEIAPVFSVLGRWAARNPRLSHDWPLSVNAAVLSLESMFDPARAKGEKLQLELRFNAAPFRVDIAKGKLDIAPGAHPAPEAIISGDPNLLLPVLYAGQPLKEAIAAGLSVEGDRTAVKRFTKLFPMPAPAPLQTL